VSGHPGGGVVWVTGLSGAGKTTVATALRERLLTTGVCPVLLDGDVMRALLPITMGYQQADRRRLASYYAGLAKELAEQGHLVICSTVSLFHEIQEWNRRNISRYVEVWLRVPVGELRARGRSVELTEMPATAEFPEQPDVVVGNYGATTVEDAVNSIIDALKC
jgi:adenylylsulfate kinase-like enzyme